MTKRLQNRIALISLVCLLCALMSGYAAVDRDVQTGGEKLPVYVNGSLEYTGYMIGGTAYVPLRSFCSGLNMGAVVTWNSGSGTMYASLTQTIVKETVVTEVVEVPSAPVVTPEPTPEVEALDLSEIVPEEPALAGEQDPASIPLPTPMAIPELSDTQEQEADNSQPATETCQKVVREVSYKAHTLSAKVGEFYMYVNDRVIYLGADVLNRGGNVLVPLNGLCRAFGITPTYVDGGLELKTEGLTVCKWGSQVYDKEDLYWLSRIINAEASNQSMEGQICVGNVVLNRVASPKFPDSVKEVVFSPNQFCPVKSGTIYCTPDEDAITAAKLCLEGVSLAGQSTYFVNPTTGATSWFRNNLTFFGSVGEHDFYY